jgi:hypothetical protein
MAYSSYPPHFLLFPIADGHSNGSEIEAGAGLKKQMYVYRTFSNTILLVRKQNTKDFKKVERNKFLLRAKG